MAISKDPLARLAEGQHWLEPIEQPLQDAVHEAFAALGEERGTRVRNLLHGTWLNEPLHAILVEIPVGSWTGTVVFDGLAALGGGEALDHAADATLVLGLVAAMAAATTGMNDWADTTGAPRRIGIVHALLNVAATGLFGAAWWSRRREGGRATGRALAALGYVVVSASAHLGGNLVYEHGIGVQDRVPLT